MNIKQIQTFIAVILMIPPRHDKKTIQQFLYLQK